jgi:hypothetical protein
VAQPSGCESLSLRAVAGFRDAPQRHKTNDSNREIEQVKHNRPPLSRPGRRSRAPLQLGFPHRADPLRRRVDEHDKMSGRFESSPPSLGARRPPAAVAGDDNQRMRFERVRYGLVFVAAATQANTCIDTLGSELRNHRFGLNRRYSDGDIRCWRKPNSSKVEEYRWHVHRRSQITRHTRCGKCFVDRREDDIEGFGADRRALSAETSLEGVDSRRWVLDDRGHDRSPTTQL